MPFAQITQHPDPKLSGLEDFLAEEWTHPQRGNAEPIIIEERERRQAPENLYAIWSQWAEVSQYARTKIILNADQQVRGRSFALNVIDAMGSTAEEADQAGIAYAPLEAAA